MSTIRITLQSEEFSKQQLMNWVLRLIEPIHEIANNHSGNVTITTSCEEGEEQGA